MIPGFYWFLLRDGTWTVASVRDGEFQLVGYDSTFDLSKESQAAFGPRIDPPRFN